MKKTWHVSNNDYFIQDVTGTSPILEPAIYTVRDTPTGQLYLSKVNERFEFGFKVYGLESKFISRVLTTYKNTEGNLGVLLNGIKGTGKTITSEILANELNLPVIMVSGKFRGLNDFLMSIQQDITVLIDEYDKTFQGNIDEDDEDIGEGNSRGDSSLLGIMDGTYKNQFRRVFLLTTNRTWLNDNMLNRPGRIRYLKHFADLEMSTINEIIDDCLKFPEHKEDILSFLKPLKIITVDIVKAVISQVNIFNESPLDCCKELNVQQKEEEYHVYKINKGKEELIDDNPEKSNVNYLINSGKAWKNKQLIINNEYHYVVGAVDVSNKIYKVSETSRIEDAFVIKIKKHQATHRSFVF